MKTSHPRHILAQSAAILLTLPGLAYGADWTGAVSSDWNTPGNWTGGAVPAGQNAYIGISGSTTAAPFTASITADVPQVVDILVARGGGPAILNHSAGKAMTGSGNWVDVGTQGGTGTYNLGDASATGGTLTGIGLGSGSVYAGGNDGGDGRFYVGGVDFSNAGGNGIFKVNTSGLVKIDNDLTVGTGNGTGLMLVDAGTITTGGWNFIGKPDNGAGATNGTLKMSGGTLTNGGGRTYIGLGNSTGRLELSGTGTYNNIGDWFAVGQENLSNPTPASIGMTGGALNTSLLSIGGSPDNPGKGMMTVAGTAVVNVDGEFWIGNKGTSNGSLTVVGGTLSAGNWLAIGRDGGTGVLTISGGIVQKTDTDGSLEITNANSATANGTLNLDGGVLAVNNITGSGGTGSVSNFFLNGGTLKPTVANGDFINGNVNPQVKNGGAVIDTNNLNIGINKALVPTAGSTGGLTKNGNGTLTLGGTSTFAGATTVNAGTLQLGFGSQSGPLAGDGPIIVNNGGTLASGSVDGTGYFNHTATNGITLNQGGTLMVLEGGRLSMDRTINSIGGIIASTGANFDNGQSYAFRFEGEAGETNSYNFTSSAGGVPSLVSATNVGVDNVTFNVTRGAGTTDLNVTGNVVNSFGAGGLTKAGNGIMVLSNANNAYTGPTKVTGGKLLINGSIATSSLTSVSAGGTLGGNGTVGSLRLEGGSIEPGTSAGILNAGNTEFAGGTFRLELNGTGTAGVNYDQLNIAGTFTLASSTELALLFGFTPTPGNSFTILSNDGTDANVLTALFTYSGSPVLDDTTFGQSGSIAYQLDYNGGTNQNDVVLNVVGVPEPTAAISVIGGAALLLGIGRRRRY